MLNSKDALTLLGGISPEQFLSEYWQKKPLLIRQAIPNYLCPVEPDELAGLAMEDTVESRIILEQGKSGPWELMRGPFSEDDFQSLPESHWTLLIQQLDAWSPEINAIKKQFQFIPNWRIDDIMASYAPFGGSVGPHFDHYDVFLLQAYGERHWRTGQICSEQDKTLEGTPLSILEQFDEQDGWILQPGDMLYLPPKLAHYGIAQNDCITLSVGFRAPTHEQILSHFTDYVIDQSNAKQFYGDPDLKPQEHCGEISELALDKIKAILNEHLNDDANLKRWFGSYITEPKNDQMINGMDENLKQNELSEEISEDDVILTNEGSRFAYTLSKDSISFFVDGTHYELEEENLEIVQTLCEMGFIPAKQVIHSKASSQFARLVVDLLNQGSLYCDQPEL